MCHLAKRLWVVTAVLLLLVVLSYVPALWSRLQPDVLVIHASPGAWKTITVQSTNLPVPVAFTPEDAALRVSPISHGPYVLRVELASGRIVWATFFQADAGVRKRVDVYIAPEPTGDIAFHETINGRETVFSGHVRPEETSEDRPFTLDWI